MGRDGGDVQQHQLALNSLGTSAKRRHRVGMERNGAMFEMNEKRRRPIGGG
jgi:hypothetical protein